MHPPKNKKIPAIRFIGLFLVIIGTAITIFLKLNAGGNVEMVLQDFAENVLGVELFGMGLTVFLIDWLYEQRDERERKKQLIRELGSTDSTLSNRAVLELSSKGWISDGTLKGCILMNSNLENADLDDADFSFCNLEGVNFKGAHLGGANFYRANLKKSNFSDCFLDEAKFNYAIVWNANFVSTNLRKSNFENSSLWQSNLQNSFLQDCSFHNSDMKGVDFSNANKLTVEQLINMGELRGSILPDGSLYNGMYQLKGDIEKARERGINIDDDNKMAEFYGVSLESYRMGRNSNNIHNGS